MTVFSHAYGGREHGPEQSDPKCLICRIVELQESRERAWEHSACAEDLETLKEALGLDYGLVADSPERAAFNRVAEALRAASA